MTILAGFWCQNGIVLGSDSEETRGLLKLPVPKIEILEAKHVKCIVAGAGSADLVTLTLEQIQLRLPTRKIIIGQLRELLTDAVTAVHEGYVDPQDKENPGVTLLSATWARDSGIELVRTGNRISVPVRRHETVGYGQDLASYLIETLYDEQHATIHHMQRLAAYVLSQTKKFAPYCGGDSQIYTLQRDGTVEQRSAVQIFNDEQFARLLSVTSRDLFYGGND